MKKHIIIFDIGGVLVRQNYASILRNLFKKIKLSVFLYPKFGSEIVKLNNGDENPENFFKFLSIKLKMNRKEVEKVYKKFYENNSKPNKKVISLVERMSKKYKVYCLTNTNSIHHEVDIRRNLFDNFIKVYYSYKLKMSKPDEKIYKYVLRDLKICPKDIISIDNSLPNTLVANNLGFNGIQFKNYRKLIKSLHKLGINTK